MPNPDSFPIEDISHEVTACNHNTNKENIMEIISGIIFIAVAAYVFKDKLLPLVEKFMKK